jgi:hypothetical protein
VAPWRHPEGAPNPGKSAAIKIKSPKKSQKITAFFKLRTSPEKAAQAVPTTFSPSANKKHSGREDVEHPSEDGHLK